MNHPLVEAWFERQGWSPFGFQRETWNAYAEGESGLVHAPTGLGKTHAVFFGPVIEWLREKSCSSATANATVQAQPLRLLWITPLRALAADTTHTLGGVVRDLQLPWSVELRSGDTSQVVKKRQRSCLPTVLVTTPESVSLLLSYAECAETMAGVRCIIVDEWHELMGTKRGTQAQLAMARVQALARRDVRVWGLSATLGNLDEAMDVLLGPACEDRGGRLIHGDRPKTTVVDSLLPSEIDRFPWAGHLGTRLLPEVLQAIEQARTTLLFTNTRSQAEIWFQKIVLARPDWMGHVALHHGSIDRELRDRIESMLKNGEIRCVVCTSSLDLGVDFSPVDQVIQIGSPKGVARLLQRAGRSGHRPGAVSRVLCVPTNALEMIEISAARDAASERRIEARQPPDRPVDVLVQHLVTVAAGCGFDAGALEHEVRSTHAFRSLGNEEWQWALDFVCGSGAVLAAYPQYARVQRDDHGTLRVRSAALARLHRLGIGTITSDVSMIVKLVQGATLGSIEESFIARLKPGDRFVFSGSVLELVRVCDLTAYVRRSTRRSGAVPQWGGGKMPLSTELAEAVKRRLDEAAHGRFVDDEMQRVRPLLELQSQWSRIPRIGELLVETIKTREGFNHYVFALEGRLVHDGLGALVAHRLTRERPRSITITSTDYGFQLLSPMPIELSVDDWRRALSTENLVDDLLACLNSSVLARRQFREIARVAGLIIPSFPGQPRSGRQLQASSGLFFDVFSEFDPENLLLAQARREVLDRELEVKRLRGALERLAGTTIVQSRPQRLTPLAFGLWAESIRDHQISSERWSDRVSRMVMLLEESAAHPGAAVGDAGTKTGAPKIETMAPRHRRSSRAARVLGQ